ncbi:hypothetical protein G6F18_013751 [Rhizopus arrhizus]|nr:hypothetical protein G6F20_013653 [Rhizopus arrhizus]KAG0809041.1 hypothetical protein G6F18_013751 [Rhizopus arrhizus]KAG0860650.1 hypothetical protein G6F15_013780 [Rhizopus arrhizus]
MRNGRKYMLLALDCHFSSDLTPDPRIYPSWPELPVVPRGRDPGAAFRGDTVMSDALVSDSASAGSHSL